MVTSEIGNKEQAQLKKWANLGITMDNIIEISEEDWTKETASLGLEEDKIKINTEEVTKKMLELEIFERSDDNRMEFTKFFNGVFDAISKLLEGDPNAKYMLVMDVLEGIVASFLHVKKKSVTNEELKTISYMIYLIKLAPKGLHPILYIVRKHQSNFNHNV